MIRSYFRGAGILALAEAILQLKGLIVLPFLTRRFGAVDYGAWSQVSVLISTIAPLAALGVGSGVIRFLPGLEEQKQKHLFSASVLFLFAMACLFGLPLLLFPGPLSQLIFGEAGEYLLFLPLAAFWLLIGQMNNVVANWFRVLNDAAMFSLTKILQAVLNLGAVALMLVLQQGVYELILYSLAGDLILLLVTAGMVAFRSGWAKPDFSMLPSMIRFGLPLVPVAFATWGLNYMDRFFIVQFTSLREVGIYSVAYRVAYQVIPLLAAPLFTMYANSSAQLFNQNKMGELQRLFERAAGLMLALTVPASVGLFLLGERIFQLVAPGQYAEGIPVMLFVSLGYACLVLSSFYTTGFGLVHKQYLTTLVYLFAVALNLVLNIILVPRFSITGAAVATFLSFLLLLLGSIYLTEKERTLRTSPTYILKILLASVGMGIIVFFADAALPDNSLNVIPELLLLAILGVLAYASFLWAFKVLNKGEVKLAFSLLGSNRT